MTATRDIYEVANQLEGYVGPDTPEPLAQFLMKEGQHASDLADEIVRLRALLEPTSPEAPHTRTGYTTVDPSEGEQAKPCYPDPVMDAVRRCAEIAEAEANEWVADGLHWQHEASACLGVAESIRREFGLLPTSET